MKRRTFIRSAAVAPFTFPVWRSTRSEALSDRVPVDPNSGYFPDRVHKFVWRNWDLVPIERMASVLATRPEQISEIGSRMGLKPVAQEGLERHSRRNQFAVIKRNWDYIPNSQLAALLRMSEVELEDFLRQDIAFLHIVGSKPDCAPLSMKEATHNGPLNGFISRTLESILGQDLGRAGEDRFAFIEELSNPHSWQRRTPEVRGEPGELDLTEGWKVVLPLGAGTALQAAARDFTGFMSEVMNGHMSVTSRKSSEPQASRTIDVQLEPGGKASSEAHRVAVEGDRVTVRAAGEPGLIRALLFLEELMQGRDGPFLPSRLSQSREPVLAPRIVFPYFARYGDVLDDPDFESYYPKGYLKRIAHTGSNGIWLSGTLRDLVASPVFPEFGAKSETQLGRLNQLVERSAEAGLGVYVYLNEPRDMPEAFFDRYPGIKGEQGRKETGCFAMCTSTPMVQHYLRDALGRLFRSVPGLAGVILITASENMTNCYSLRRNISCPRCRLRAPHEVVAEVVGVIAQGVKAASPTAEVIAWDWSWPIVEDDPQEKLIQRLPENISLMADFERGAGIERGGIRNIINEYCLSVPGPSERAAAHLNLARKRGLKAMAKIQLSTTWECGSMPFIPVLSLLGRKFQEMLRAGVQGAMQSWTLGSCPSVNTDLAAQFYWDREMDPVAAMKEVATRNYGRRAAAEVVRAWEIFGEAFQQYPFSNSVVYSSQVPYGPAHPLYFFETGQPPSLQNSRDSLSWTSPFGPAIVAEQFAKMASRWGEGVRVFSAALERVDSERLAEARKDLGVARALQLHFESVANQIHFLEHRNRMRQLTDTAERHRELEQMKNFVLREQRLAAELWRICMADSRIGFEAFFQYIYRPQDILEKIVSCGYIADRLIPQAL